jgi:hypothetical protein
MFGMKHDEAMGLQFVLLALMAAIIDSTGGGHEYAVREAFSIRDAVQKRLEEEK